MKTRLKKVVGAAAILAALAPLSVGFANFAYADDFPPGVEHSAGGGATYVYTHDLPEPLQAAVLCVADKQPAVGEEVLERCSILLSDSRHYSAGTELSSVRKVSFDSVGLNSFDPLVVTVYRVAEDKVSDKDGKTHVVPLDVPVPVGTVTVETTFDVLEEPLEIRDDLPKKIAY